MPMGAGETVSHDTSAELEEKLKAFYGVFNKELVPKTARLVAVHNGDVDIINHKLREKYGYDLSFQSSSCISRVGPGASDDRAGTEFVPGSVQSQPPRTPSKWSETGDNLRHAAGAQPARPSNQAQPSDGQWRQRRPRRPNGRGPRLVSSLVPSPQ
jgi:hypothetical protein